MTKLWSHKVAQDPAPEPVDLEILRKRFGNSIVIILPLSDGTLAVLGADRQPHAILAEAPSLEDLTRLSAELESKLRSRPSVLRAEGKFYGEPADGVLARDLKRARDRVENAPVGELEW